MSEHKNIGNGLGSMCQTSEQRLQSRSILGSMVFWVIIIALGGALLWDRFINAHEKKTLRLKREQEQNQNWKPKTNNKDNRKTHLAEDGSVKVVDGGGATFKFAIHSMTSPPIVTEQEILARQVMQKQIQQQAVQTQ